MNDLLTKYERAEIKEEKIKNYFRSIDTAVDKGYNINHKDKIMIEL